MVSENTSCHQAIADSLAELKTSALELREKVRRNIEVQKEQRLIYEFQNVKIEKNVLDHNAQLMALFYWGLLGQCGCSVWFSLPGGRRNSPGG